MPGLISSVFQPDEGEAASAQDTTVSGTAETGIEASPSIGIGLSGSYEDADGTTHEWSNETQIGADVDLDVAVGVVGTLAGSETSDVA